MKASTFILLALLTTFIKSQNTMLQVQTALDILRVEDQGPCDGNCITCGGDSCFQCLGQEMMLLPDQNMACNMEDTPTDPNCSIFTMIVGRHYCATCNEGYVWDKNEDRKCRKVKAENMIKDCLEYMMYRGQTSCYTCDASVPSVTFESCVPAPDLIQNCFRYSRQLARPSVTDCELCTSGYVYDRLSHTCVLVTSKFKGCLQKERENCIICDYENGYFAKDQYTCVKKN